MSKPDKKPAHKSKLDSALDSVTAHLETCQLCKLGQRTRTCSLPSREAVRTVLEELIGALFPGCHGICPARVGGKSLFLREHLRSAALQLREQVEQACCYQCEFQACPDDCHTGKERAETATAHLVGSLQEIQRTLQQDIQAAFEGDPAARSPMEIVMSYPCVNAVATYRLAHVLYEQNIPIIPRVMTEIAHSRTGIDIHPGAVIGPGFFIDHGTGVVIGETCVIGRNVKLYQGVTLGALSFPKDKEGNPIKGTKRHPEVHDNVTIYAEATILGGNTVIGEGSEIGGNVWLTRSVPPHSKVYNVSPPLKVRKRSNSPRRTAK